MNVINEKGQRVPSWEGRKKKEKNIDRVWTTNFQCSVVKPCMSHNQFVEIWSDTFWKKKAVPFPRTTGSKTSNSSLQSSLHGGLKICDSCNRTQRLQSAPVPVHSTTHTTKTRSMADSTRHFLYTSLQSTLSPIWLISHCNTWVTS